MIRPEYWRKVYKPAYAKIVAAIKGVGCFAHLHTDGVTDAIMEDLIEIGFDELNPQMSCMDVESVGRRSAGGSASGGHGPAICLPFGTPRDVTALVERLYTPLDKERRLHRLRPDQYRRALENAEAMLVAFSRLTYRPRYAPRRPSGYSVAIVHSLLAERIDSV